MNKQPSHDACDEIYGAQLRIESVMQMLKDNKLIASYEILQEIRDKLVQPLIHFREKALKEEGEQIL